MPSIIARPHHVARHHLAIIARAVRLETGLRRKATAGAAETLLHLACYGPRRWRAVLNAAGDRLYARLGL